ncbi:conserved exported hypothetical protein [Flavobacterium sp. 9AF]|uniref:DUF1501 domain-containing protein n=1 Tax=Flavobacterium sp. 9AF TaxID=2653142 RepID=UPI0012F16AE2|nr:DUF1501 domain-containing protein [Flavobacterium sp. 9AF]VXB26507.1 conserved exported hypothetical protein [Flavobacterium sp. 9AF]
MKRRKFIQTSALVAAPLLFNKIPVLASSHLESSNLRTLANAAANCGKILVIIQMSGGNDGLNMVFPRDKWSELTNARPNILLNENEVLTLNNNLTTGLHPAMPELQELYNLGELMIVQGVSYPNPSYSHFRATDIWFTASQSDETLDTGWIGRALDEMYPNFPEAYPNSDMRDPLAIQIGSTLPFSLQGPNINMGYSAPDPNQLLNVINETTDPAPNTDYGLELTFLRLMKDQSNAYKETIQTAYNVPQEQTTAYPDDKLAAQLKIVARLINGGLQTPIYIVNHPNSFDTHENQIMESDKKLGRQPENLALLSKAIGAFQSDLKKMGKSDKVTGMTFSEFGRRIKSNDSLGTDHGSSAPVIFFGSSLNTGVANVIGTEQPVSGMIGSSPNLPQNATVNNQVPMQYDFKQLYATIMKDWLCMTEEQSNSVLGNNFETLPIFRNGSFNPPVDDDFILLFPNPISNNQINVAFKKFINTHVKVSVHTVTGKLIYANTHFVLGDTLTFSPSTILSKGVYVLEITYRTTQLRKKFFV